jgi:hypothetical protein
MYVTFIAIALIAFLGVGYFTGVDAIAGTARLPGMLSLSLAMPC